MAKVSMIARENKRIKMVQKFAKKREELKKVISDMKLSDEERYEARLKLQKLPRDASPVRLPKKMSNNWKTTRCLQKVWPFKK